MKLTLVGPFTKNFPFGTEIAFAKGLRQIGVDVVEVDPNLDKNLDGITRDSDAIIVFKTCVGNEPHLERFGRPVIVYQPDDARFPHIREMMLMMRRYSDLFLSFDDYSTQVSKTMGYRASETLLLTADPDLYSPSPWPVIRDIDVSFIGSLGDPVAHASRRRMLEVVGKHANKKGWVTAFGTTQDIPEILDTYRRSKVVLNHATDVGQPFGMGYGLQCRMFETGMTRTCLLSSQTYGDDRGIPYPIFFDEHSLTSQLDYLIETGDWQQFGAHLYESIQIGHLPIHRARQLVDFVTRNV